MKIIEVIWRDPSGSLVSEKLEQDKFQVQTDRGWLHLFDATSPGSPALVRLIPSERVCLVQFADIPDQPRILRPTEVTSKFQPS